jgi:hypothetical protein
LSQFEYIAVLISIIVGLSLTQILRGVGRIVTTQKGPRPYWVHLIWTLYLFLNVSMFWWWEFRLGEVDWSLSIYLVVIIYATLYFFISLVMHPANVDEISSYKDYFYSHRRWIFGLLITIMLWDFVDTSIKGYDHLLSLGNEYLTIQFTFIAACVVAAISPNERYHKIFASVWIIVFPAYQFRTFFVIE